MSGSYVPRRKSERRVAPRPSERVTRDLLTGRSAPAGSDMPSSGSVGVTILAVLGGLVVIAALAN